MSKSNIEERLFKVENVACFDPKEGKRAFSMKQKKPPAHCGVLSLGKPSSITRIRPQMTCGSVFKEKAPFIQATAKKSQSRKATLSSHDQANSMA